MIQHPKTEKTDTNDTDDDDTDEKTETKQYTFLEKKNRKKKLLLKFKKVFLI